MARRASWRADLISSSQAVAYRHASEYDPGKQMMATPCFFSFLSGTHAVCHFAQLLSLALHDMAELTVCIVIDHDMLQCLFYDHPCESRR